jgi:5-deoxy-D-glucuronate isomerase
MSAAQTSYPVEKMVFRKTNQHKGRHISVTPDNSTNRHLSYGRIILDRDAPSIAFNNGNQETGLICLSGHATLRTAGESFEIGRYDSIYIPRDSRIEVSTAAAVDFAEFSSDVEKKYPLQFVSYAERS